MRQKFLLVPESNSMGLRLSRPLYHYTNRDISAELTIWIPIMVRCQRGNLRSLPSPGLRYTVADVDGRLSGMLGLEVLKLSESASTALIYPGKLSVTVRSCPVAVHIFRDRHVTNGIRLYVCLTYFYCNSSSNSAPLRSSGCGSGTSGSVGGWWRSSGSW